MSRLGVSCSLLYVLPMVVCIAAGLCSDDPKSRYVWLQIPVALQMSILQSLGLVEHLAGISWAGLYAIAGLPVVAGLYAIGFGVARLSAKSGRQRAR